VDRDPGVSKAAQSLFEPFLSLFVPPKDDVEPAAGEFLPDRPFRGPDDPDEKVDLLVSGITHP
jgi:hypothetical protein